MDVILFQPQIPQNTGNVVRTCKVTGSGLILVKPLGFSISSRQLKRAGLDYWEGVDVQIIDDLRAFLKSTSSPFYFFSSKAKIPYTNIVYPTDSLLIFGSETSGLPADIFEIWSDRYVTIPMLDNERCLNLSNSVAIALYEAWRQQSFSKNKTHQKS